VCVCVHEREHVCVCVFVCDPGWTGVHEREHVCVCVCA